MFTGIVGDIGRLMRSAAQGGGRELCFSASPDFLAGCRLGESIAVNGACQTVSACDGASFCVFASAETLVCTNLKNLSNNAPAHLERSLKLGDRFDGHIVTGHVDGVGRVFSIQKSPEALRLTITLPRDFLPLAALKGSLAVDGISLTVQGLAADRVTFVIIPESIRRTTIAEWAVGREVNIELDILARYTARWLAAARGEGALVSQENRMDGLMRESGYAAEIRRED
jgi:riboflavin synthase